MKTPHTTIKYIRQHSYGRELIYVEDSHQRQHINTLTGRQTLTRNDIKALRALGFDFQDATKLDFI